MVKAAQRVVAVGTLYVLRFVLLDQLLSLLRRVRSEQLGHLATDLAFRSRGKVFQFDLLCVSKDLLNGLGNRANKPLQRRRGQCRSSAGNAGAAPALLFIHVFK